MADTNYPIEQDPVYDPNIRALQDTDPTRASTVFNPLIKKIINNVHAVKLASDGKAPTNHASSGTTHGIATASLYGHPMASSATPLVAGTATVGTDNGKYEREGHVHPAQTSVTGSSGSCTGNAATATKLQTARTINGVSFDGTANITVADSTKAPARHASSATTYGVASASNYGHAMASGATPLVAGTAAVGSDNGKFAREGHVHPVQATLPNARTIDGVNFDGSANIHHFGTCSTVAATAAKTVAVTGFVRATGARVAVKFTIANTAANPTLNVNNTGAVAIYYKGTVIPAGYLQANGLYEFVFNGTQYELITDDSKAPIDHASTDTIYGVASTSKYGHAMASSATPLVAGTAAVGTDNGKFVREGHVHPAQTSVTGNAGTATKLQIARTINGASFDGTANITIADSTKAPTNHASSATTYGVASASNYGHAMASGATPLVAGTAAVGTDNGKFAREGHVHPAQAALPNARTIDGISFNGDADIHHFSTCSTTALTAAKTVSITGFTRATGARVTVKFTNGNTATNPTLNVTSTGSAAIYYKGANLPADYLQAGIIYAFVFNGSQYEILNPTLPSTPTSHASTGTEYGVATESLYGHAMASSATPPVAGTAAVGTDNGKFAREGHVHPAQTSVTGNAGTATKLQTARTINGVSFDGTANITITDSTKAPTSHASSATTYGVASASNYGHSMASGATPLVAGTATPGTDNGKYAREGHVHPAQTSITGNAATATRLQDGTSNAVFQGPNGIRILPGANSESGYGVIFRNDGNSLYALLTNKDSAKTGNWNNFRPFYIGLADGVCNISGNAVTASRLQNGRNINGVHFNGENNITITANPHPVANNVSGGNWNNVRETGFYMGIEMANAPFGNAWFYVLVMMHNTSPGWVVQQAHEFNDPTAFYIRTQHNGTWSSWVRIITSDSANQVTAGMIANVEEIGGNVTIGYAARVDPGYPNSTENVTIGRNAYSVLGGCIAIGANTHCGPSYSVALGYGAKVDWWDSVAIGKNSLATTSSQILLGSSGLTPYAYKALSVISDERDKIEISDLKYDPVEFIRKLKPRQYKTDFRAGYAKEVEVTDKEIKQLDEHTQKYRVRKKKINGKLSKLLFKYLPGDNSKAGNRFHNGFVAQEVKAVADEMNFDFAGFKDHAVNGGDDIYSLSYEEFIAPMVATIQKLMAKVELLEAEVASLKA